MGVFLTCQPCSAPGRRPAFCFHFPPSLPLPRLRKILQRIPQSAARAIAPTARRHAGKPAQPWRSADARKAVHWLNAARDAVKAGRHPWPRSGPWRTNPTCARCSSNGGSRHHRGAAGGARTQRPAGLPALDAGRPMRSGAYGIQEPAAGDELPPDVVLAPTLGFTQFGDRVGYGGGYYDRTLAALTAASRHRHRLELRRAGRRLRAGRTRLPAGRHPDRGRLGARGAAVATRQGRQDAVFRLG